MLYAFAVLDVEIVLEEVEIPSCQAASSLFVREEPLKRFMVSDDCETLELNVCSE